MLTEETKRKIEFVKKINEAYQIVHNNVEQVTYKIFESDSGIIREYLVVTYKGGARAARNCTGDSYNAIVEELGKLVYGGYYDEVGHLERYECSPEYKLINESSAKSEIIYCGECKYMMPDGRCSMFADPSIRPSASDYCSNAERRQDVEDSKEMTSAEPERKKGKWIERWHDNRHIVGDMACSVCGAQMTSTYPKTCPSCGADMRGDYSNSQA